jgi:HAMP domain-containing protein
MKVMGCTRRFARGCYAWLVLLVATASVAQAAEPAGDIRDIRGPKSVVPGSWLVVAVLAGVLVVAVCLGYILWRRRHREVRPRSLTLSEQTLERLEATRPLLNPATAREFGIAASEVIRTYIEKRFQVVATQRTTEEFLQALLQSSNEALARHRSLLAEFLQQCDFVKFAGASLAVTDMEALFQSARGFVLQTSESPVSA